MVTQEGRKVSWYYQTSVVAWYDAQVQQKKGFYTLFDMTHKSNEIEICLLGDNLTKKRKVFYKEQRDKLK